jgi:hypothetical protein
MTNRPINNTTHNSDGTLTKYGLSCGYVQRHGEITLTKDGCYHVKETDGSYWETYQHLTDARRDYARLVRLWDKAIQTVNNQDTADGLRIYA